MNSKACNIAVLSELGAFPYSLRILKAICKNWYRIINSNHDKLLYGAYKCNSEILSLTNSNWLNTVKNTLKLIECEDIWNNGGDEFGDFQTNIIQRLLHEKFLIQWQADFYRQSFPDKKLRTYSKFKSKFEMENYLLVLKNIDERRNLTQQRITAHNL